MTEHDLLHALSKRYPSPEWAFVRHVRNTTGFAKTVRTLDACAMGCWPSSGLELLGFEIKTSRSDWLREKKAPEKSDAIAKYMDRFYLVCPEQGVASVGEVPERWGLLHAREDKKGGLKLIEKKPAKARPDDEKEELPRAMLASLLRSALKEGPGDGEKAVAVTEAVREAQERFERTSDAGMAQKALESLEAQVKAFEDASGIRIARWGHQGHGTELGRLVKLMDGAPAWRFEHLASQFENAAREVAKVAKDIREAAADLERVKRGESLPEPKPWTILGDQSRAAE